MFLWRRENCWRSCCCCMWISAKLDWNRQKIILLINDYYKTLKIGWITFVTALWGRASNPSEYCQNHGGTYFHQNHGEPICIAQIIEIMGDLFLLPESSIASSGTGVSRICSIWQHPKAWITPLLMFSYLVRFPDPLYGVSSQSGNLTIY